MHFTCGQTISQSDRGGFLVLNSDLLPAGHQYDCRVVIQPESTKSSSTSGYHVLFHFSDFEVGRYCQDTNVTVLDGNGINMSPIEGTIHLVSPFVLMFCITDYHNVPMLTEH